ncbi:P3 protein [Bombina bombina]|uniref:P3 protein n=1 Tax=Bombina bombina TaxID=8345 RepID=UPI00235A7DDC|nr:P3 protein [Bombina bombina]
MQGLLFTFFLLGSVLPNELQAKSHKLFQEHVNRSVHLSENISSVPSTGQSLNVSNGSAASIHPTSSSVSLLTSSVLSPRFLQIGDGCCLQFDFLEHRKGVIVINTGTAPQSSDLSVESLDTSILRILNVSRSTGGLPGRFLAQISSGMPGTAHLLIRLQQQGSVLEERDDFSIRVIPQESPDYAGSAVGHFSESPLLYALLPLLFINKCAFGCKVDLEVLKGLLVRPHPLILGILGQFVLMPLYSYILSRLLGLSQLLALGLLVTCSSPGGGGGYLYSLLLGGDVTLAISMTLVSTVAAVALMPLSSSIYGRFIGVHHTMHIPFLKILATLLFIAVPISTGMFIKWKFPGVSRLLLHLIKPFSVLLMVGGLVMAYQMGSSLLSQVPTMLVAAALTVPLVGLIAGYLLATCLRLPIAQCRTVSIEVGVQNSLLALAVLQLSFPRTEADISSQAPFLVALSGTSEMLLIVILHATYRKLKDCLR